MSPQEMAPSFVVFHFSRKLACANLLCSISNDREQNENEILCKEFVDCEKNTIAIISARSTGFIELFYSKGAFLHGAGD